MSANRLRRLLAELRLACALTCLVLSVTGCRCEEERERGAATKSSPLPQKEKEAATEGDDSSRAMVPLVGGALFRDGARLYVADEDHSMLRIVELPLQKGVDAQFSDHPLPGRPAQVVAWEKWVAVTIREPSLLLLLEKTESGLSERNRISLPADAWGIAVTADRKRAWVTSAWGARVSNLDLAGEKVRFDFKVKREPRGLALGADGLTAYVTHLTSADVTILKETGDEKEPVQETIVPFPAAPLRSPAGVSLSASLAYAPLLSPDEKRLFVPRHALGALGKNAWFGAMSVDVLLTPERKALAPARGAKFAAESTLAATLTSGGDTEFLGQSMTPVTQPRAALLRKKANTILVVGEGDDRLAEFDASAPDPTLSVRRIFELGRNRHEHFSTASVCGAPTGMALSEDEDTVYVYCRATDDLIALDLGNEQAEPEREFLFRLRFEESPSDKELALGKSIFFNATDRTTSGGLACAGCHPEGRDDGHVWHEATFLTADGVRTNFVGHEANLPKTAHTKGVPRRTPMLAGRLKTGGPFGWHGESKTLPDREIAGFALHRWGGMVPGTDVTTRSRALFLSIYLRKGLVAPVTLSGGKLHPQAARGEEIFLSKRAACSTCHVPETNYTNQEALPLPPLPTRLGFDAEENQTFKTPSLRGLVGRAPYFHDGSATSLFNLIETNHDRMGFTSHLGRADRDALIAFLETL